MGNRKDKGEINEASLKKRIYSLFVFEQALKVAEKHFSHEEEVLLLTIDLTLLKAEIKYELASNYQEYPHVFRAINIDAIIDVVPLLKENGEFILPELQR